MTFADRLEVRRVADITEFPTGEGKLFLAATGDLFHRGIVGWDTAARQDAALVVSALTLALARTGNPADVIHHADKGTQYMSLDFAFLAGIRAASRRVNSPVVTSKNACHFSSGDNCRRVWRGSLLGIIPCSGQAPTASQSWGTFPTASRTQTHWTVSGIQRRLGDASAVIFGVMRLAIGRGSSAKDLTATPGSGA